jgi:hypothetical protein
MVKKNPHDGGAKSHNDCLLSAQQPSSSDTSVTVFIWNPAGINNAKV